METIQGYQYDKSKGHNSPNGTWYKAQKDGIDYFLKQFNDPKYPLEGIDQKIFDEKIIECEKWLTEKKKLIEALNELGNGTGNIVSPREVFRNKNCFYQATHWIDIQTDSLDKIKRYPFEKKLMVLKTFAGALKKVHSKNIIHGDLKPDNILIGISGSGNPVAKLIDFDDSYFSKQAPSPDDTVITDAYQSPELATYKRGNEEYREELTCQSDVFASGIIFHQFWCGEMPNYPGKDERRFLYEAVISGDGYQLDSSIPDWLQKLIRAMLQLLPEDRPTMEEVHNALLNKGLSVAEIDCSKLEKVLACIPQDLSLYTDESVHALTDTCNKIKRIREKADQTAIDKCTKVLYAKIKNLKPKEIALDYSLLDDALKKIPADLSGYTFKSRTNLKKVTDFIEKYKKSKSTNKTQEMVQQLAALLEKTCQELEKRNEEEFSIKPVSPIPAGYSSIEILTESRVCASDSNGNKVFLPRHAALELGLVCLK